MKLLDKYEKHSEIYKAGFIFDPESSTFFTEDKKNFKQPEGYEDWNVEVLDLEKYGKARLKELGITDKVNTVPLFGSAQEPDSNEQIKERIFTVNKRGGIEILQYGLDRRPHFADKNKEEVKGKGTTKGLRYCFQLRLHPWEEPLTGGKYDFSQAKAVPFWSPTLLDTYENEEKLNTLVITEGQFKAFKASIENIPTVGLTSISHFRDKETNSIHPEIIEFVQKCKVEKVVVLWDGDCTNISSKDLNEQNDLSRRPNQFYKYAQTIRTELKKYVRTKNFKVFFATINSEKIQDSPKGIDDLFTCGVNAGKIREEFNKIGSTPTVFIHWEDITTDEGVKSMRRFFGFDHVNKFYQKHSEQIKERSFVFFGSTYKVEKGVPILEVSKDLKVYKRIGTEYYQMINTPVPNGKKGETVYEERLVPWSKTTIIDDHGKDAVKHVERFKGFTNVANHIDYQAVIAGHWNLYYNVNHATKKGDFPTIKKFLLHLFEEHFDNEMIYDYLTILYRNPMQKLPIIGLVSKEQETGKSTFLYLLKLIFKQNLAIISNNDLTSDFNSHWTSSLIVASEETLLEKKDGYEKLKSLSTAFEINRNEKNKTSSPIPCMIHFVLMSNHEDDFIKIDDYDSRLWIRKVGKRKETIPNFDQMLEEEIPYFVDFIANREIKYQTKGDRLYFAAKDFETSAKRNLIDNSEPGVIKDLRLAVTEYFHRFEKEDELKMTIDNIKQYFGIKGERNFLNRVIKNYLKPEKADSTTYHFLIGDHSDPNKSIKVQDKGRCFIFLREKFIKE